jgi:uncharacterized protein YbaR (Trm112 family)
MIECPFCKHSGFAYGFGVGVYRQLDDGERTDVVCPKCDKWFDVTANVTTTYTSHERIEK